MSWPGPGPEPEPQLLEGELWSWASGVYVAGVQRMRERGWQWAEIESYLGMAPGSAERAYGPLMREAPGDAEDMPGAGVRYPVRDDAEDGEVPH